ncbi:MAG: hypothetical protein J6A16_02345 [Oscillospiraceae bacterium]|nr:hypothetical protein [Oscillospiraceae bacterium]
MWKLTSEVCTNEEGVTYTAYGLRCKECHIPDISSVKENAERVLQIMNDNQVSTIHAADVLEDLFGTDILP